MAVLKLDIIVDNLNQIKKAFENVEVGDKSGGLLGGIDEQIKKLRDLKIAATSIEDLKKINKDLQKLQISRQQLSNVGLEDKKKKKEDGPSALGIGVAVSFIEQLVKSTDAVVGLLKAIGGLLNQLIAPFVPILLSLIKPVFVILNKFIAKFFQTFFSDTGEGTLERTVKQILSVLAGIGTFITALVLGVKLLPALLAGAIAGVLTPGAFDLGGDLVKFFADKLSGVGKILADTITFIDEVLNTDFAGVLLSFVSGAVNLVTGLGNALVSLVNLDFSGVADGFKKAFFGLIEGLKAQFLFLFNLLKITWTLGATVVFKAFGFLFKLLKNIFQSAVQKIAGIWSFLLSGLKSAITSFASAFVRGLNALIGLLNKIPGVDIGRVSAGNTGREIQTNISINVEGSADEKTLEEITRRLAFLQSRQGGF
jgi:hypothetical protein